jgi:hypothetical protein
VNGGGTSTGGIGGLLNGVTGVLGGGLNGAVANRR